MKTFTIQIEKGIKVLSQKGMVTLSDNATITGATRESGGEFKYNIGENIYFCSAGCCEFKED